MNINFLIRWRGCAIGRSLDLQFTGRGFESLHSGLEQATYTYDPLSQSSVIWYRPREGDLPAYHRVYD